MQPYSVLMSVYAKEKPEYLKESMQSILLQTVPADELVLVCDGPLTPELDAVIKEMKPKFFGRLVEIRLPVNRGLGSALNEGMKYCRNELIARMDSDDISRPERCALQLEEFERHPELSVISGTVEEFVGTKENVTSRRVLPSSHEEIMEFAKTRSPFNHPCVMYRKSDVEAVGGYHSFYLLEDYYLWVRMLANGKKGRNLRRPLLWMRAGSDMYKRRSGKKYAESQRALFRYMYENDMISHAEYLKNCAVRTVAASIPNGVRERLYAVFLRSHPEETADIAGESSAEIPSEKKGE